MKAIMTDPPAAPEHDLLARWVDISRSAGPELEAIRRREIQAIDTCEAVRQIFGCSELWPDQPPRLTSGLVEQQAWFAKLRHDPAL
jgi:hypothetical protein